MAGVLGTLVSLENATTSLSSVVRSVAGNCVLMTGVVLSGTAVLAFS